MKIKKITDTKKEEVKVEEPKEPVFYVFRTSDTLESVAKKFNTTVEKIKKLNGNAEISASNQMRVK